MTDSGSRPNSKVARVIETSDIVGIGEELEALWTGADGERKSLRDLADLFNRSVLAAAMRETGHSVVESDVESAYETLTDGDATTADRMRKRRELERAGLDVDAVLDDFVTHQAIHTYLRSCRGAELPDRSTDRVETLERLRGRTGAVAESIVEALVGTGEVTDHEYEILVDIRAVCPDCGSDFAVVELLNDGGCNCDS